MTIEIGIFFQGNFVRNGFFKAAVRHKVDANDLVKISAIITPNELSHR